MGLRVVPLHLYFPTKANDAILKRRGAPASSLLGTEALQVVCLRKAPMSAVQIIARCVNPPAT